MEYFESNVPRISPDYLWRKYCISRKIISFVFQEESENVFEEINLLASRVPLQNIPGLFWKQPRKIIFIYLFVRVRFIFSEYSWFILKTTAGDYFHIFVWNIPVLLYEDSHAYICIYLSAWDYSENIAGRFQEQMLLFLRCIFSFHDIAFWLAKAIRACIL